METSQNPGFWVCGKCSRRVPGKVDICRCGAPRGDATISADLPALPTSSASPAVAADAARPALSGGAFVVRIALAVAVFGGLGAGWYGWTKNSLNERNAAMMQTRAAMSRRVHPEPQVVDVTPPAPQVVVIHTPSAAPPPAAASAAAPAAVDAGPIPLEDLIARVAPAVVLIQTSRSRGTGFFVQPDTILTNAHVAGSDSTVRVRRTTGDVLDARVERVAPDLDLAMLKLSTRLDNQAVLPLGSLSEVRSGEDVVAIGSALGVLQSSVTRGIVSAIRKTESVTFIQTDAALNPGNSGGPLLDRSGTVIGINTLSYGGRAPGISFAVAAEHAREFLAGQHLATTSRTAQTAYADAITGTSDPERAREAAAGRYERALAQLARRADDLDGFWRRFKRDCYEGSISGSFDREWFSLFEPKSMHGAVSPGCTTAFSDVQTEAHTIKNTAVALEEAARKEDIFPGTRRQLRQKYHLDYAGWDR